MLGKFDAHGTPINSGDLFQVYPTCLVLFSRAYTRLPGSEIIRSVPDPLSHEFAPDGFEHMLLSGLLVVPDLNLEADFTEMRGQLKPGHRIDVTTSADIAAWLWGRRERFEMAMRLDSIMEDRNSGVIQIPMTYRRAAFTLCIKPSTKQAFEVVDYGSSHTERD